VAKRNKNSEYCFAFAELKDQAAAAECVKKCYFFYKAMTRARSMASKSRCSSRTTPREERIPTKDATTAERWDISPENATPRGQVKPCLSLD